MTGCDVRGIVAIAFCSGGAENTRHLGQLHGEAKVSQFG